MRFTYAESLTDPSYYLPLAQAAEAAGYHAMSVPDSLAYLEESDSTYPYSPDSSREFLENAPILEPFALIAAMGAVTERLRFTTFVVKLPIRPPVQAAKLAASVAVLTGNRLQLGVGTSPWPEDYEISGVPWAGRGKRMDEAIAIIRGLTAGGYHAHDGEVFQLPSMKLNPVPDRPIPILIGGHHDAALRRAARIGDGWLHAGGDPDELEAMITRIHQLRAEHGRADEPFEVHAISLDAYSVDGVRRLAEAGVTDAIVGFRFPYVTEPDTEPLADKIGHLERFAEDVIAKVDA